MRGTGQTEPGSGSTIERAFELARSGEYRSVQEIKRRLRDEGFAAVDAHLAGRGISDQLRAANPNAPALGFARYPRER
jgi:hypothetical protein